MSQPQGVAVLEKALDLLECMIDRGDRSVAELSEAAGVTKAAAYRVLSTLEKRGYVTTYGRVRRYSIGHAFHAYIEAARSADRLLAAARPAMKALRDACGETVNLAILARGGILYLEIFESAQSLRATAEPGSFDALHSTALGKAILSRLPADERDILLGQARLVARTEHTVTNVEELREAIRLATSVGCAIDDEENEIGMRCVAAPIVNAKGRPLAAISVSGPSSRMSPEAIDGIGKRLLALCGELSDELGA